MFIGTFYFDIPNSFPSLTMTSIYFIAFVFVVFAILFEVCFVLASLTGTEYVGVAGVFLKDVFLGLLGSCAFLIPIMLLSLTYQWKNFII